MKVNENEIIGGEAEAQCWKEIFREFEECGFLRDELEFEIITCAKKNDGARIFFPKERLPKLINKYFESQSKYKDSIVFDNAGILIKMNYGIGLAFIHYLIVSALIDMRKERISQEREDKKKKETRVEKNKIYIETNLKILLCCFRYRKMKCKIHVFYREKDKKYYAVIETIKKEGRMRSQEKIIISHCYPKNIIRKAAKIFFNPD